MPRRSSDRLDPYVEALNHHIAQRLRRRRRQLRLSQATIAEALGVAYQQVHKYETGETALAATRLPALAKVLDVGPGYFFEEFPLEAEATAAVARTGLVDQTCRPAEGFPRRG